MSSATSSSWTTGQLESEVIAQRPQIRPDLLLQPRRLREQLAQFRRQSLHLLVEGLAVVLGLSSADVAARGEHIAVLCNLLRSRAPAEAGHVGVAGRARLAA